MIVIVLLVVLSICIATGGGNVEVTFTSSHDPPNIAEGDTAVFNCSSNHSSVPISWLLNKSSASTFTSDGVIVNGGGTPVSSLIIPGLVDPFNNTEVLCYASGPGFGDLSPPSVMLKVQGVPALVDNLTLSNESCCYTFSWTAPFTLPGFPILRYNVNVTSNNVMINETNVSGTQWTYCPQEPGTRVISIAAVNEVGEGKMNYHQFVEESEIRDTKPMYRYLDIYQNQIIHIKLYGNEKLTAKFKKCKIKLVELKCTDSDFIFNSSNITDKGLTIFNISAADKIHKVITHITLESGLVVSSNSSNPLSLRFFDVFDYKVLSRVSTNVSFQCTFLKGSKAIGCCVFMEEMTTGKNYSLNITRENTTVTGKVTEFVETGNYGISIYDINFDGNQASEPAYSTTIVVTSQSSTPTASSSPTVITSPTPMSSTTPSETTGTSKDGDGVEIAVVIGIILGITGIICFGIILIVIVLVAFVCLKHKAHSKKADIRVSQNVNENRHVKQENTVNYIVVERPDSNNAPACPPSIEISKTVYSEIAPANCQAKPVKQEEEYSRLNHRSDHSVQEFSQGPSDYSILEGQQDQTGSMLYDTVTDRQAQGVTVPSQYSMVSNKHM